MYSCKKRNNVYYFVVDTCIVLLKKQLCKKKEVLLNFMNKNFMWDFLHISNCNNFRFSNGNTHFCQQTSK